MNFEQIIERLKTLNVSTKDIGYGDFPKDEELGETKEVFSQGGEGEGERWVRVYHFIKHDIYLSMRGHYTSYDGANFEGYEPIEVKPKEKTITVYE